MTAASLSPIRLHALEVRFLVDHEDSNGRATVFETRIPAGAMVPPPHSHDGFEETVYGLEGVFGFTVDGTVHEIGPGQALCIERGQVHSFDSLDGSDGSFLSVATPGIFRPAYFQELAEVLGATPSGPPDVEAIFGVMHRHGLTPARMAPTS